MLDLVSVIGAVGLFALIAALRSPLPTEPDEPVVTFGVVTVNLAAHTVSKAESGIVKLTPTEWHFLEVLMRNPERLVTRHFVLTTVWGLIYQTGGGYLRLFLGQLRKKLEPEPSQRRFLPTEPGIGHCFAPGHGRGRSQGIPIGTATSSGQPSSGQPSSGHKLLLPPQFPGFRRPEVGSPGLPTSRNADLPECRRPGMPTSRNAAVAITPRGGSHNSRRDAHLPPRPVLSPATSRPPPRGGDKRSRYLRADG